MRSKNAITIMHKVNTSKNLEICKNVELTCMRAVNRQPMFTARGTRRAFSFINKAHACAVLHQMRINLKQMQPESVTTATTVKK